MRIIYKESDIYNRFHEYSNLLREIENQTERFTALLQTFGEPSASNLTGVLAVHNGVSDGTGNAVARIEELRCEIEQAMIREKSERAVLEQYISSLSSPDERAVLRLRYFDRLTWEKIGDRLHFSSAWLYVLHKRAFHNMEEKK